MTIAQHASGMVVHSVGSAGYDVHWTTETVLQHAGRWSLPVCNEVVHNAMLQTGSKVVAEAYAMPTEDWQYLQLFQLQHSATGCKSFIL
jgi:hypothetical protein